VVSPQTLSESDRRLLAGWAATCAEHVLPLFTLVSADDAGPREALARTRAFARGEGTAAEEIRLRFVAGRAARAVADPAAVAAASSVAQAAAVAHMGAHALGAAGYAVKAVRLDHPDDRDAGDVEIRWQVARLTQGQRVALRLLPLVGTDRSGPLGPGLLSRGVVGDAVRRIQELVRE
jgi:hypothetical protein